MGGHLVQQGGAWAGCGTAQSSLKRRFAMRCAIKMIKGRLEIRAVRRAFYGSLWLLKLRPRMTMTMMM